jgi:hypothetical protein
MTDGSLPAERLAIALLHSPVYNRNGEIVTTAVTNLDLHDIARAARTYGVGRYYVVTPVPEQRELAERILRHWREGWGATYNPHRKEALGTVSLTETLEETIRSEAERGGGRLPKLVATGARGGEDAIDFPDFSRLLREADERFLLLFGTGSGLAEEVTRRADYILAPVIGVGDYNHLSVRSAVSIILDRLLGR